MAELVKYKMRSVKKACDYFERGKNSRGNFVRYKNWEIDASRSHLNYNLHEGVDNQIAFVKKRLREVKCLNRADVNIMCEWVVYPFAKDFQPQDDFFKHSYNFLVGRYGVENVVSSYVHLDEWWPNMHFAFIPVIVKNGIERVSAKDLLNLKELYAFHRDWYAYLEKMFGRKVFGKRAGAARVESDVENVQVEAVKSDVSPTQAAADVPEQETEEEEPVGELPGVFPVGAGSPLAASPDAASNRQGASHLRFAASDRVFAKELEGIYGEVEKTPDQIDMDNFVDGLLADN